MAAGLGHAAGAAPPREQGAQDTLPVAHPMREKLFCSPSHVSASFDCGKRVYSASCKQIIPLGIQFHGQWLALCVPLGSQSKRRTHQAILATAGADAAMAPSKSSQEEGAAPLQPSNESSQSRQQAAEAAVRPRLRWTPELHEQFLHAVKELKVAFCRLQLLPRLADTWASPLLHGHSYFHDSFASGDKRS